MRYLPEFENLAYDERRLGGNARFNFGIGHHISHVGRQKMEGFVIKYRIERL